MLQFGITRNFKPTAEYINYENRKVNRYVDRQLRRLKKYTDVIHSVYKPGHYDLVEPAEADTIKKEANAYWVISGALIKRSKCFRVMALHHVFPQWYKKTPFHVILKLLTHVAELAAEDIVDRKQRYLPFSVLEYKRVYIPKGDT